MTKRHLVLVACMLPVLFAGLVVTGCGAGKQKAAPATTTSLPAKPAAFSLPAASTPFGSYTPVPLLGVSAPPYAGPATPHSLTDVSVAPEVAKLLKNPGVPKALAKNGFVVVPTGLRLFQYAYEGNVYGGWPVFVTTDVAYHEWHLVFDKTLRSLEQDVLLPKLERLVSGSLQAARAQRAEVAGTALADPASRVEQLFEVAAAELGEPVSLGSLAKQEKALVDAHSADQPSPLLGVKVDYSLFTPRGHYTRTAALTRFFVAMSVLGQLPFCLPGTTDCPGDGPARLGILAARTLVSRPQLEALWRSIYEPTAFLVGRADDYTPLEVGAAAKQVDPGWLANPKALTDDATVARVLRALVEARPVLINPDRAAIRFLGTRFVVDSYVLDQLIYPNVGTEEKPRLLPSGLDLPAAFGSSFAHDTLKAEGATAYAHYDVQLDKVRKAIGARSPGAWGSTVYDAWLNALVPLFAPHGTAFPDFMRTPLWSAKEIQTGLGSYAELKHDTVLFAKQFQAEGGDQLPPSPLNWVEPDPVAFGRLAATVALLRDGLARRDLLTPTTRSLLTTEVGMFGFFERIAKDELAARAISKKDNDRLRFIGGEFEELWFRTSDLSQNGLASADQADAVVADLGSSPQGVLEVGTGAIDRIYVLVPDGQGKFEVALGGVYSYYEFTSPPGTRLDDTAWRTMLDRGTAPARPAWEAPIMAGRTEATPALGP